MRVRLAAASVAILALTACAVSACGNAQPTRTVTVTTVTTPEPGATTSAPPAQKKGATTRRTVRAASAMRSCDATIAVKRATTSCAFGENVFYGYWKAQDQGDDAIAAYSATTEQSYPISCTSGTTAVCRAGDGAEVRFPMAAIRAYTAENAAHYAATHDIGPSNPADGSSASPGDDGGSGGARDCDPNYEGQCLDPNSPDYDCQGGSGNGPDYTGPVTVVGDDHFGLDRDGDGSACES